MLGLFLTTTAVILKLGTTGRKTRNFAKHSYLLKHIKAMETLAG